MSKSVKSYMFVNGIMEKFFRPDSIAVIGASQDSNKIGGMIFRNIIASGFTGELYPINIKGGSICGIESRTSVESIGKIDLAVIAVPAMHVVSEMKKLASIGTKNVIIVTAGFKEEDSAGRIMEEEIHQIAKSNGIRVIGPNCFGVVNTYAGMNATFSSLLPPKGNVALCSQSGAVGATMFDWSRESHVGISKFASLGNKMDVNESDLIRYFGKDKETKVIGIYSEGISNGEEFLNAVEGMNEKRPIVMFKAGRTSAGSRAASSHTGALAGSDSVYDAAFRKMNIIRAEEMDEMFDLFSVFSLSRMMHRNGIAIITNAGGLGVMAADACSEKENIELAELSQDTVEAIRSNIPSVASALNPIDLRGDAKKEDIEKAVNIVSADENVGGIVILASPLDMIDLDSISKMLCGVNERLEIPMVVCFAGGSVAEDASKILRKGGIATFPTPDRAVKALSSLRGYKIRGERPRTKIILPKTSGRNVSKKIISKAMKEGRISLSEEEGKKILSSYGIPVPDEGIASSVNEACDIAERIGFPVVMKVLSSDIHHKTDVGGVIVGIKDRDEVIGSYESIMTRSRLAVPDAKIDGVSIQKMASGQEVILSMIRDEQFGPVISFGLGGIYVEIMKEIAQSILPMSYEELEEMIMGTKAFRLLSGARGKPPADVDSMKDIMLRLMKIAEENPELYELEINPVMVGKKNEGSWAVDALVTLRWK